MAKSIVVLDGRARLSRPTKTQKYWRITWKDPVSGQRKETRSGRTYEDALVAAASIVGDIAPAGGRNPDEPPTLQECFDSYVDANSHKWNPRTLQHYRSLAKKFLSTLGGRPVTEVTPTMLKKATDISGLSQGQRLRVRAVVKGTFSAAGEWVGNVEPFTQAIVVGGTKGDFNRNPEVARGDVPSSTLVASFINCAYGTMQVSPIDPPGTTIDALTGEKHYSSTMFSVKEFGLVNPLENDVVGGLPVELVKKYVMRKIPLHYNNREGRMAEEVERCAEMYRRAGLVMALGAGGGLRIGEVLALRPRHFFTMPQAVALYRGQSLQGMPEQYKDFEFAGAVDVLEQASTATGGTIYITHPKGNRTRTVHLPAFLPSWNKQGVHIYRKQISEVVPRFADDNVSLWSATDEESFRLWRAGFVPLAWMLMQRFHHMLWEEVPHKQHKSEAQICKDFLNMLMFPTSTPARNQQPGHVIQTEQAFKYDISLVEDTGGYQVETAYANKYANPIYDYVAQMFDSWPAHRVNATKRKGWTHHGLRHYAASTRMIAGVPIPIIARELGHKDGAFTLQRYGHFMPESIPDQGFEY